VVDITLGQDSSAYHILIEFYASGNLILTDSEYNIISLLRTHKYDEDTRCAVGEKYPFTHAANLSLDSIVKDKSGIEQILQESEDKKEDVKEDSKDQGIPN
jgi:predicted ribosome quality control (RQC) complex YloA/Tae2 family protein